MSKLTMMVCPHDTVQEPERWFRLEQYLMQKMGIEVQFELALDFLDFRENVPKADIVYTNPSDKINVLAAHGFTSVARPMGIYDEVVFVANTEVANPSLESLQGAELVTVVSLIPTHVALHMLQKQSISPGTIRNKDSWQGVVSSVWNAEAPFGLVYKDTYDSFSDQGKGMVHAFAVSDEKVAFHTLDIAPALADRRQEIEQVLFGMSEDEQGRAILKDLHFEKWLPVTQDEVDRMVDIMKLHS